MLSFLLIILLCLPSAISGLGRPPQSATASFQTETRTPFFTDTPVPLSTKTTKPPTPPTKSLPPTQVKLESIPADYNCPDKNKVKLQVGVWVVIGKYDVNLRDQPVVPDVHDANIIMILRKGDKAQIVEGPVCAHNGTWWQLKTETGRTGWSREQVSAGTLLFKTDN